MSRAVESLPSHLKVYIDQQHWSDYTPRDHAVWRFIMNQNIHYFGQKGFAVPEYSAGLEATGIDLNQIPKISEMDACLDKFGWGAIPVCGFIPPIAFLEFQSFGVLPIATHMRRVEHMGYTPAPDIVHESAGHAPILVNEVYSIFLKKYANVAKKAIDSKHNIDVYEAVRYLSDIKEVDGTTEIEIEKAEKKLAELKLKKAEVGEVAEAVRLYWWTAEYGLLGDMNQPKVYGAGLLSSIGESQRCLSAHVKKIPLNIDCVKFDYDITEPQPQLFVARKFDDLLDTLDELDSKLSYRIGGRSSLVKAIAAETVVTVKWSNTAFVSGLILKKIDIGEDAGLIFFGSAVQIGVGNRVLVDRKEQEVFVVPYGVGKYIQNDSQVNIENLKLHKEIHVSFGLDLKIKGKLLEVAPHNEFLKIENAELKLGDQVICMEKDYFCPLGEKIVSVEGGPKDMEKFGDYYAGAATTTPIGSNLRRKLEIQNYYRRISDCRFNEESNECCNLGSFIEECVLKFPNEWMLFLELFGLISSKSKSDMALHPYLVHIREHIGVLSKSLDVENAAWLEKGYRLLQKECN